MHHELLRLNKLSNSNLIAEFKEKTESFQFLDHATSEDCKNIRLSTRLTLEIFLEYMCNHNNKREHLYINFSIKYIYVNKSGKSKPYKKTFEIERLLYTSLKVDKKTLYLDSIDTHF